MGMVQCRHGGKGFYPAHACVGLCMHQYAYELDSLPPSAEGLACLRIERPSSAGQRVRTAVSHHMAEPQSAVRAVRSVEEAPAAEASGFMVGVAPSSAACHGLGDRGCGVGMDCWGFWYMDGRYCHTSDLAQWERAAKPLRCVHAQGAY